MTAIKIVRESSRAAAPRYRALAGSKQGIGATPGQALDALTAQWSSSAEESSTLLVIQPFRPDAFFSQAQQMRLQWLMDKHSTGKDDALTPDEAAELERLVESEWRAAIARSQAMVDTLDGAVESAPTP